MKYNPSRDISAQTTDEIDSQPTRDDEPADDGSSGPGLFAGLTLRESRPVGSSPGDSLYMTLKRGIEKIATPVLLIPLLWASYSLTISDVISIPPSFIPVLFFPVAGVFSISDLDDRRVLIYRRVSSESQRDGASLSDQKRLLNNQIKQMDGQIVGDIAKIESAASTKRESLEKVFELAKSDEFNVLAVKAVHRLTRANAFESARLFERLREKDITLYTHRKGVIDWDDVTDRHGLIRDALFSRRWYEQIQTGAESGCTEKLKQGKWPSGGTPYGYEKDDDGHPRMKPESQEIIHRAFELYMKHENRSKARKCLNERLRAVGEETMSDSQLKTLLQSKFCIGWLEYDGDLVNERPELRAVDNDIFIRAQDILDQRSNQGEARTFPPYVDRALARYGLDHLHSIIGSLAYQCNKCGGDYKKHGSDVHLGTPCKTYECQDCGHQSPLLTESEMKELHQVLPLRCPYCPQTEDFECEELPGFNEYRYICQTCGHGFKSSFEPDKLKRGIDHSELAFDVNDASDSDTETQLQSRAAGNTTTEVKQTDNHQTVISRFLPDGAQ
jgi:DNA invertase Pin-like site-specific DNA recombinase/DNA-directed RNA polymerase subunit RPC12/RpoP